MYIIIPILKISKLRLREVKIFTHFSRMKILSVFKPLSPLPHPDALLCVLVLQRIQIWEGCDRRLHAVLRTINECFSGSGLNLSSGLQP